MPSDDVPCPTDGCENDSLDTGETNDALRTDAEHSYFCHHCGGLFTEADVEAET
jgi:hypothetical protein